MKLIFTFLLLSLFSFQSNAQQLNIKPTDNSIPLEIFKKVRFVATISNDTGAPIQLFRNHLTSYGGLVQTWRVIRDGKEIKSFNGHPQDTNSGFTAKNFKEIQNGGSYPLSGYSVTLDGAGAYEIIYEYSQDPKTVKMGWGETGEAKSLAQKMTTMQITKSFKFVITAPKVKPFVAMNPSPDQYSDKNAITSFAHALLDPTNAFNLKLFINKGEDYSQELNQLPQLKNLRVLEIYIGKNDVTLPKDLGQIPLKRLIIKSKGGNCNIPNESMTMTSLEHYHSENAKYDEVPSFLANQKGLKSLTIYRSNIAFLPDWIGEFSELEELTFTEFRATSIPASFAKLTKLKRVQINKSQINRLEYLFSSPGLKKLLMDYNQLSEIAPQIGQLKGLQELSLRENKLTTIPKEVYDLSNLGKLDLDKNRLISIPDGIDKLTKLWDIGLSDNQLTLVPIGISKVPRLKYFDGRRNKWKTTSELKSLKKMLKSKKGKFYVD